MGPQKNQQTPKPENTTHDRQVFLRAYGMKDNLDPKTIKWAVVLGCIPFAGPFGIHDEKVGRRKQMKVHICLAVPIFFIEFLAFLGFACDAGCSRSQLIILTIIAYSPIVLFIISYIWAILESSMIYQLAFKENIDIKKIKSQASFYALLAALLTLVPFIIIMTMLFVFAI